MIGTLLNLGTSSSSGFIDGAFSAVSFRAAFHHLFLIQYRVSKQYFKSILERVISADALLIATSRGLGRAVAT